MRAPCLPVQAPLRTGIARAAGRRKLEADDGPPAAAAWSIAAPYGEHAGLHGHVASHGEKLDGQRFKRG